MNNMLVAGAALSVLAVSGCAAPVALTDPSPGPTAATICKSLLNRLPDRVLEQKRRRVRPGLYTAAWGDPPITLSCGGTRPASMRPGSPCFEVNSVGWFAEQAQGGYLFTTMGRAAYVEVGVPGAYAPEANALVDLAAAVGSAVPLQTPCL